MIAKPKPSGEEGHILKNPVDPQSCVGMLCYKVQHWGLVGEIIGVYCLVERLVDP